MIDKQANKQLSKGLKTKERKRKLLAEILSALENYDIKSVWAHKDFVSAVERRPKNVTIYVEFSAKAADGYAEKIGMELDKTIKKQAINIIDVNSLLPSVKEFVFKDVEQVR